MAKLSRADVTVPTRNPAKALPRGIGETRASETPRAQSPPRLRPHFGNRRPSAHQSPAGRSAPHSPCYLVSELLAGDNGDLLAHALVGVEVIAQARVVLLDDDPGRLLHGLGTNAALRVEKTGSLPAKTSLLGRARRHVPITSGSTGWGRARERRGTGKSWSGGAGARGSTRKPAARRVSGLTGPGAPPRGLEAAERGRWKSIARDNSFRPRNLPS